MKHLWFKRKKYGWGWTPASWQGWVVMLVFAILIAVDAYWLRMIVLEPGTFAITFIQHALFAGIILVVIAYFTGESPIWQWGMSAGAKARRNRLNMFRSHDGSSKFFVLAFDHRGSFVKMMQEHSLHAVEKKEAIDLKQKIITALNTQVSGILIDEDYGLPAYNAAHVKAPYLLPVEKTGYTDAKGERITVLERTAAELKTRGAQGVKLLLYVHHLAPSWAQQMETARKVIEDAHNEDLPVFLEFVLYSLPGLAETSVVATVEKAMSEGVLPDVWKLPYPGSAEESAQITHLVDHAPWVLLTGGGTFENFVQQYTTAVRNGASGFVAGRSLWQEATAVFVDAPKLKEFLMVTLPKRFEKLRDIKKQVSL